MSRAAEYLRIAASARAVARRLVRRGRPATHLHASPAWWLHVESWWTAKARVARGGTCPLCGRRAP